MSLTPGVEERSSPFVELTRLSCCRRSTRRTYCLGDDISIGSANPPSKHRLISLDGFRNWKVKVERRTAVVSVEWSKRLMICNAGHHTPELLHRRSPALAQLPCGTSSLKRFKLVMPGIKNITRVDQGLRFSSAALAFDKRGCHMKQSTCCTGSCSARSADDQV